MDTEIDPIFMHPATFGTRFDVSVPNATNYLKDQHFQSSVQVVGQFPCYLLVYPGGNSEAPAQEERDNVAAYLAIRPDVRWLPGWKFEDVTIAICLKISSYLGRKIKTGSFTFAQDRQLDFGWTCLRDDPAECKMPGALFNASNSLCFEVSIHGDSLGDEPHKLPACRPRGFSGLWTKPLRCTDMAIKTDSGATFECHRVVLSLSSPVLERMLDSGFREAGEETIRLQQIHDNVLEAMLEFMYTGSFSRQVAYIAGRYVIGRHETAVSTGVQRGSDLVTILKPGMIVDVLETQHIPQRIRGRLETPPGWISLITPQNSDAFQCWARPECSSIFEKLSELADMYDMPDLYAYCTAQLVKNLYDCPTRQDVRQVSKTMRKRPRTTDTDELHTLVKRRFRAEPDLVDALLSDD